MDASVNEYVCVSACMRSECVSRKFFHFSAKFRCLWSPNVCVNASFITPCLFIRYQVIFNSNHTQFCKKNLTSVSQWKKDKKILIKIPFTFSKRDLNKIKKLIPIEWKWRTRTNHTIKEELPKFMRNNDDGDDDTNKNCNNIGSNGGTSGNNIGKFMCVAE